jgi:hypothetical protein
MPKQVHLSTVINHVFSAFALIISLLTLYFVRWEPQDVSVFPAERIGFDYSPNDQTLGVVVPVLLSNHGARPAVVQSMALVVSDPTRAEPDILFLKWDVFAAFDNQFVLQRTDRAVPVSLLGSTSQSKYVGFSGGPDFAGWMPKPKTYTIRVLAWTREGLRPDIATDFQITFSKDDCATFKQFLEGKRGLIWWVDRGEWGRWKPKILSAAEHDQINSLR